MNAIDITKITPPATMAELIAFDATREIPYLKARLNRIGIHVPGPNPQPAEIIPYIQQRLDRHLAPGPLSLTEHSGDYVEWKLIREEYEELIAYLKNLEASRPATTPKEPKTSCNETATKPGKNRDDSATTGQPIPNHQKAQSKNREETGKEPEQSREQTGNRAENPAESQQTEQKEPAKVDNAAIAAEIKKLNLTQTIDMAIQHGFLPDHKTCDLGQYAAAFLEWAGPPRQVRLDQLDPEIKTFILALIEELTLKKAQDKLMLPPPFGPYILTCKSSLSRFRTAQHAREARRNQRALDKQINQIVQSPGASEADCNAVTEKLLLIQATLHPEPDLIKTKTLVDMLEKIRSGKLAERKLQLAESK